MKDKRKELVSSVKMGLPRQASAPVRSSAALALH